MFANPNGFQRPSFSGRDTSVSTSANKNVHTILNDPDVLSLERLLRVLSKFELRLPGRLLDKPPVSVSVSKVLEASAGENASVLEMSEASSALRESGSRRLAENSSEVEMLEVSSALRESRPRWLAEEVSEVSSGSRRLAENSSEVEMLEVSSALRESRPRWLAEEVSEVSSGSRRLAENVVVSKVSEASSVTGFELVHETAGDSVRISELLHATAGDGEGIIGLHVSHSSFGMPINSSNSLGCVAAVACARLPAVPGLSAAASSSAFPPASLTVVAHASSTPMHSAHNSWSDTGRV